MKPDLRQLLRKAVESKASDLHIMVNLPPVLRIDGQLIRMDQPSPGPEETDAMLAEIAGNTQCKQFDARGELDFSYAIKGVGRFRINAYRQQGSTAFAIRVVAERVPTLRELGHPPILTTLADKPRGLILVTGPTGSGKTTTLAAMIDHINRTRFYHIITLEDPIEYLYKCNKSIINQREVGTDTVGFAQGLREALREDPDVILIGEMRDVETIGTALTAAETGHLVMATLHTGDAAQTVDRIMDGFPSFQQQQVRIQLSLTLQGIVSQQLLPRSDGQGRVAALEILIATPAIRNLIREGKTHQLSSSIQTGTEFGMISMDRALRDLYRAGTVAYEEAVSRALDPETFMRLT